jgi:hypothetical protein
MNLELGLIVLASFPFVQTTTYMKSYGAAEFILVMGNIQAGLEQLITGNARGITAFSCM